MITAIFENNQLVSYSLKTWQYDYGQILRIEGLNLPTAVEIHFSLTEKGGESVTRVGMTKDGVTDVVIPDSFLENNDITQDYWIYAFIYLRDDTSGQTEYKIPISVTSRPKPEAFDRPEDGEIFKEAIQAVRQSADQAAESVRQAEAIKESVQDMVDTIGSVDEKVQAVKEFSQKAETASSNAALSESRAKESKTAAETAKTAAVQSAESARWSATAVEQAVSGFDGKVVGANIAIESAKTKAVKAVEDKGNEVLQSIPPDFETQMENKVDKQQGIENKGKTLVVGDDGNVVPGEVQSGGDGIAIVNTASGESPLVIPDSAEEKILDFRLTGNTQQVSTTGAQLLDKDTFFFNPPTTFDQLNYYPFNIGDKECTLSTTCPISSNVANLFLLPGNVDKGASSSVNGVGFGVSRTAKSQDGYVTIALRTNGDNPYNPLDYDIMLNYGSAATSYEPYTGGKPSPSPEYPQEIKNSGKWNEGTQKYDVDVILNSGNLWNDKAMIRGHLTNTGEIIYKEDDSNCIWTVVAPRDGKYTARVEIENENGLYFIAVLNSEYYEPYIRVNPGQKGVLTLKKGENKIQASALGAIRPTGKEKVILSYGDKEPPIYEPYKESKTLILTSDRPITKWDKLVEQDGQIGWLYGGKIVTLTGDEEWISNLNAFYTRNYDIKNGNNPLCSHYVNKSIVNQEMDNIFSVGDGAYANSLWIRDTRFSTVKDFSAHLLEMAQKGEPITVIASSKTETPGFVPLPQEQQEAIRALKTYYPTTAITADGGEVNPNIEVTYTADTKNYIDKKNRSYQ